MSLTPIEEFLEEEIEKDLKLNRRRMIKAYVMLAFLTTIMVTTLAAAIMSVVR